MKKINEDMANDVWLSSQIDQLLIDVYGYLYRLKEQNEEVPIVEFDGKNIRGFVIDQNITEVAIFWRTILAFDDDASIPLGACYPANRRFLVVLKTPDLKITSMLNKLFGTGSHTAIHEFTHVYDLKRRYMKGSDKVNSTSMKDGLEGYINDPLELNAFFNEVAQPLLKELVFMKNESDPEAFCLITPPPPEFLSWLMTRISSKHDFKHKYQALYEKNKRRLISRAKNIFDEYTKQYNNCLQSQSINESVDDDVWISEKIDKTILDIYRHLSHLRESDTPMDIGTYQGRKIPVVKLSDVTGVSIFRNTLVGFDPDCKTAGVCHPMSGNKFAVIIRTFSTDIVECMRACTYGYHKKTLIHELTHVYDIRRRYLNGTYKVRGTSGRTIENYINDPLEFNAFFQEFAEPLLDGLTFLATDKHPDAFFVMKAPPADFKEWVISRIQNADRKTHYEALTEKNRRRIIARAKNLFDELWKKYKEFGKRAEENDA